MTNALSAASPRGVQKWTKNGRTGSSRQPKTLFSLEKKAASPLEAAILPHPAGECERGQTVENAVYSAVCAGGLTSLFNVIARSH
ncbi:hypothetical protein [Afipia felis]